MIRTIFFLFLIAFVSQNKVGAQQIDMRPQPMRLNMPRGVRQEQRLKADSNTYTILLLKDSAYCYRGTALKKTKRFSLENIVPLRNDLLEKKKQIGENKMVVLIRPAASATYQDIVNVLDEMTINSIKRYAMDDVDESQKKYFHVESFMDFNPPSPVEITMPTSVASTNYPDDNAVLITIDKNDKVYFSVLSSSDSILNEVIVKLSDEKKLNLTKDELEHFKITPFIGVPFSQLIKFLDLPVNEQKQINQPGIPVDSLGGELTLWISVAKQAFVGKRLNILIKGDNNSGYKVFKNVIEALKRNELFKYQLVTSNGD